MPFEPLSSWIHWLYVLLRENDEWALFLLLLVEESGAPLPLPGDTVIIFAGYRASVGQMSLLEAGIATTLAVQLGSTILYLVSRRLGRALLLKYGRFVHLDTAKLEKMEQWIRDRGPIMVFVGRLTPGLRTATSVMAGVFKIPFHQFLFYTTLSAAVWSGFWLFLGYFFGAKLLPLVKELHSPVYLAAGLGVLAIAALLVYQQGWHPTRRATRRPRSQPDRREQCT